MSVRLEPGGDPLKRPKVPKGFQETFYQKTKNGRSVLIRRLSNRDPRQMAKTIAVGVAIGVGLKLLLSLLSRPEASDAEEEDYFDESQWEDFAQADSSLPQTNGTSTPHAATPRSATPSGDGSEVSLVDPRTIADEQREELFAGAPEHIRERRKSSDPFGTAAAVSREQIAAYARGGEVFNFAEAPAHLEPIPDLEESMGGAGGAVAVVAEEEAAAPRKEPTPPARARTPPAPPAPATPPAPAPAPKPAPPKVLALIFAEDPTKYLDFAPPAESEDGLYPIFKAFSLCQAIPGVMKAVTITDRPRIQSEAEEFKGNPVRLAMSGLDLVSRARAAAAALRSSLPSPPDLILAIAASKTYLGETDPRKLVESLLGPDGRQCGAAVLVQSHAATADLTGRVKCVVDSSEKVLWCSATGIGGHVARSQAVKHQRTMLPAFCVRASVLEAYYDITGGAEVADGSEDNATEGAELNNLLLLGCGVRAVRWTGSVDPAVIKAQAAPGPAPPKPVPPLRLTAPAPPPEADPALEGKGTRYSRKSSHDLRGLAAAQKRRSIDRGGDRPGEGGKVQASTTSSPLLVRPPEIAAAAAAALAARNLDNSGYHVASPRSYVPSQPRAAVPQSIPEASEPEPAAAPASSARGPSPLRDARAPSPPGVAAVPVKAASPSPAAEAAKAPSASPPPAETVRTASSRGQRASSPAPAPPKPDPAPETAPASSPSLAPARPSASPPAATRASPPAPEPLALPLTPPELSLIQPPSPSSSTASASALSPTAADADQARLTDGLLRAAREATPGGSSASSRASSVNGGRPARPSPLAASFTNPDLVKSPPQQPLPESAVSAAASSSGEAAPAQIPAQPPAAIPPAAAAAAGLALGGAVASPRSMEINPGWQQAPQQRAAYGQALAQQPAAGWAAQPGTGSGAAQPQPQPNPWVPPAPVVYLGAATVGMNSRPGSNFGGGSPSSALPAPTGISPSNSLYLPQASGGSGSGWNTPRSGQANLLQSSSMNSGAVGQPAPSIGTGYRGNAPASAFMDKTPSMRWNQQPQAYNSPTQSNSGGLGLASMSRGGVAGSGGSGGPGYGAAWPQGGGAGYGMAYGNGAALPSSQSVTVGAGQPYGSSNGYRYQGSAGLGRSSMGPSY